jgi:hypothetical protein
MKALLAALLLLGTSAAHASDFIKLECDFIEVVGATATRHPMTASPENDENVQSLFYKSDKVTARVSQYEGDEGYLDRSIVTKSQTIHSGTFMGSRGDIPRLSIQKNGSAVKDRAYIECRQTL